MQDPAVNRADLCAAYKKWQGSGYSVDQPWGMQEQMKIHNYYSMSFQLDIHESAAGFFFWHRAFLYFHERNMACLNSGFRLPFWNWDLPACASNAPFCGFSPEENPFAELTGSCLNWSALRPPRWPSIDYYCSLPPDNLIKELLFSQDGSSGPHSWLHSGLGFDMVDVGTSARDPIFYPFHANFDRIWAACQENNQIDQISSDRVPPMTFFDLQTFNQNPTVPGSGWVTVNASDLVDYEKNLGYTYDLSGVKPAFTITERRQRSEPTDGVLRPYDAEPDWAFERTDSHLKIALFDIELATGAPGTKWTVSIVDQSRREFHADFVTAMPHSGHPAHSHSGKPTFPYLLVDVTESGISREDFRKRDLRFFLSRVGHHPKPLKAKKTYQVWTKKT